MENQPHKSATNSIMLAMNKCVSDRPNTLGSMSHSWAASVVDVFDLFPEKETPDLLLHKSLSKSEGLSCRRLQYRATKRVEERRSSRRTLKPTNLDNDEDVPQNNQDGGERDSIRGVFENLHSRYEIFDEQPIQRKLYTPTISASLRKSGGRKK
jgi:hypothetical protein